jgi:hypothetical protein
VADVTAVGSLPFDGRSGLPPFKEYVVITAIGMVGNGQFQDQKQRDTPRARRSDHTPLQATTQDQTSQETGVSAGSVDEVGGTTAAESKSLRLSESLPVRYANDQETLERVREGLRRL